MPEYIITLMVKVQVPSLAKLHDTLGDLDNAISNTSYGKENTSLVVMHLSIKESEDQDSEVDNT